MPTQRSDIKGGFYGIQYTDDNEKWTVAKNVSIKVRQEAIYGDSLNSAALVNKGSLSAERAIYFLDILENFNLKNTKSGKIKGDIYINVYYGDIDFTNDGSIKTKYNDAVDLNADEGLFVSNTGKIVGKSAAVRLNPTDEFDGPGLVTNSGILKGGFAAIAIEGSYGNLFKINNKKGSILEGGQFALYSEEAVTVKNKGTLKGNIALLGDHDDNIVSKGGIEGNVLLGDGDDTLKFKGKGFLKSGMIDGGDGRDTIILGKSAEKILIDFDIYESNEDYIQNFKSGDDRFYLNEDEFRFDYSGKLSKSDFKTVNNLDYSQPQNFDGIIYDKATGVIFYSYGGDYPYGFALLEPGTKLKASDFRIGEYSIDI